jgi:hypothetical protein
LTVEKTRGPPKDPDEFQLVDVKQLKQWVQFVVHSVRRRKWAALGVWALVVAVTIAVLAILPRTYQVDAQLLTQRHTVMPALGNPGRTVPTDANVPTRAAAETVLGHDNLLSLMKQTDLLNHWERSRTPILRFKDWVFRAVTNPSEEDRVNAMVGFLENRFHIGTTESTITIGIDWPEPQMAYTLVDNALQNFLEQRHSAEVSSIAETISILESHVAELKEQIDNSIEEVKHGQATPKSAPEPATPLPRRDPAQDALRTRATELRALIEAKRRAINELEDFRRRRLAELQSELTQKRAVYADAHPVVAQVVQSIAALQEDSPQSAALRKEERDLQAEYDKVSPRRSEGAFGGGRELGQRRAPNPLEPDVQNEYSRTRLRFAMEKYDTLLDRLNSARIELDTARAAFKYRYTIVRPPQLPKRPVKPKVPFVLGAGVLAATVLAVIAAALADLRSGRILETWQVERALGLEVLGELPRA